MSTHDPIAFTDQHVDGLIAGQQLSIGAPTCRLHHMEISKLLATLSEKGFVLKSITRGDGKPINPHRLLIWAERACHASLR